jgi:hypothetical protein
MDIVIYYVLAFLKSEISLPVGSETAGIETWD